MTDELVERCWAELEARRALTGLKPCGIMIDRDDLAAIIPIVQAEQRERDAGVADNHISYGRSDWENGFDSACASIATAIRKGDA